MLTRIRRDVVAADAPVEGGDLTEGHRQRVVVVGAFARLHPESCLCQPPVGWARGGRLGGRLRDRLRGKVRGKMGEAGRTRQGGEAWGRYGVVNGGEGRMGWDGWGG